MHGVTFCYNENDVILLISDSNNIFQMRWSGIHPFFVCHDNVYNFSFFQIVFLSKLGLRQINVKGLFITCHDSITITFMPRIEIVKV